VIRGLKRKRGFFVILRIANEITSPFGDSDGRHLGKWCLSFGGGNEDLEFHRRSIMYVLGKRD
jgi:hypothetical protein